MDTQHDMDIVDQSIHDDDLITNGKYIIIRRTFDTNAVKLVKVGTDKLAFCLFVF